MILIAHKDECYEITGKVPDSLKDQDHPGAHWGCTCGGVKIRVELAEAHDKDNRNIVGRIYGIDAFEDAVRKAQLK